MNIPKTIKQATGRLAALDTVATATEWERAAIVYAFTEDGDSLSNLKRGNASPTVNSRSEKETPEAFARRGIAGLRAGSTVRMYRDAWKQAMKDGAPDIKPGDPFVMPATTWPPTGTGTGLNSVATLQKQLVADPVKTITKIITGSDGDVSEAAVEAMAEGMASVTETKKAVVSAILKVPTPTHTRAPNTPFVVTNWNVELWGHLTGMLDALRALREDKFTLDAFNSQGLLLLEHVLPEVVGGRNDEADRLFADIEDFLSKKEATS